MALDTDKFKNVVGWCGPETANILYTSMLNAPIPKALELGVFAGLSTCIIAQALHDRGDKGVLISCDYFPNQINYRGTIIKDPLARLWEHLNEFELASYVTFLKGNHASTLTLLESRFGLVYIDGGHYMERVLADAMYAWKFLEPGGFMVFHDYGHPDYPDVKQCIDMLVVMWKVELKVNQITALIQKPMYNREKEQ